MLDPDGKRLSAPAPLPGEKTLNQIDELASKLAAPRPREFTVAGASLSVAYITTDPAVATVPGLPVGPGLSSQAGLDACERAS